MCVSEAILSFVPGTKPRELNMVCTCFSTKEHSPTHKGKILRFITKKCHCSMIRRIEYTFQQKEFRTRVTGIEEALDLGSRRRLGCQPS